MQLICVSRLQWVNCCHLLSSVVTCLLTLQAVFQKYMLHCSTNLSLLFCPLCHLQTVVRPSRPPQGSSSPPTTPPTTPITASASSGSSWASICRSCSTSPTLNWRAVSQPAVMIMWRSGTGFCWSYWKQFQSRSKAEIKTEMV